MEKFVPYEKMSKRERRALDRQRRGSWGAISPVSRRIESKKRYNRKKAKQEQHSASPLFYFFFWWRWKGSVTSAI